MESYFSELVDRLENNLNLYVGYPPNIHFDYSELYYLLKYPLNNLGDPFSMKSIFGTQEYEIAVIEWFLALYGLKKEEGWGYVTNGGSEGVLFGLWNGREKLKKPVVYYSDVAHYSVSKAINLLSLPGKNIPTNKQGILDYNAFEDMLEPNSDAIFLATIGSTITSSIDDVKLIQQIMERKNVRYYIHADAAIDGMVLPFLENTTRFFTFNDGIESISISGHKIIGSPIPCGIAISKTKPVTLAKDLEIVRNKDGTLLGSRDGFAPLILWYAIKRKKVDGFKSFIQNCIYKAKIYCDIFNQNGIAAWRFNDSISIVLDKLPEKLLEKWRAPSNQHWTTLTALPKLDDLKIDEIISDYKFYLQHKSLPSNHKQILFPKYDKKFSLL